MTRTLREKKHKKHGSFVRAMRKPSPHGRLEHTRVDPDSPEAFYYEETKSPRAEVDKARRGSTYANVRWIEVKP